MEWRAALDDDECATLETSEHALVRIVLPVHFVHGELETLTKPALQRIGSDVFVAPSHPRNQDWR
jgi:hypothetical protein